MENKTKNEIISNGNYSVLPNIFMHLLAKKIINNIDLIIIVYIINTQNGFCSATNIKKNLNIDYRTIINSLNKLYKLAITEKAKTEKEHTFFRLINIKIISSIYLKDEKNEVVSSGNYSKNENN